MGNEQQKSRTELSVFHEFIERAALGVDLASICKTGAESEPDIYCTLSDGTSAAFELVEICASEIARGFVRIGRGEQDDLPQTSDPTERILRQKLHKIYKTDRPIELLCYTNGRTMSPDDQVCAEAMSWANAIKGPFRRVWLLGEKGLYEVWSA